MAEKNLSLRFYNGSTGYSKGETFGSLYAYDPTAQRGFDPSEGNYYGRIDWTRYDGIVQINYITVKDEFKRLGIATALLDQLNLEFPKDKIKWSGMTDDGSKLHKAYKKHQSGR